METVSFAFPVLCLILYTSGWSEVENEQRSGCGEKKLMFLERDIIASYLSDLTRFQHIE